MTTRGRTATELTTRRPAPAASLLRNEFRLLFREPAAFVWAILVPVVADIVMAVLPASREPLASFGGLSVWQTYLPVLIIFTLSLLTVQVLPSIIAGYREAGILRRLRTTPVSPAALLGADVVLFCGLGLLVSAVLVGVPVALGNRLPGSFPAFALACLLSLVVFVALGACVMSVAPTGKFAAGIGSVLTIVLWFAAGLWVPRIVMPPWMRTVCDFLPGGAAADTFNRAMADAGPQLSSLLVLAAWTLVCLVVAVRAFRWE
jgi:ABC-2 type transport system permease protein